MLDGPRPRPDRPLRALGAVRVHRDEPAVLAGLLDGRPDLVLGQLRRTGDAAAGQHRAGADALDQVGPADQQTSHALADLRRRGHDAEPEVFRQADVVGESDDVAATPRRGDERARALHPRPIDVAAVDRVAQRAVG